MFDEMCFTDFDQDLFGAIHENSIKYVQIAIEYGANINAREFIFVQLIIFH